MTDHGIGWGAILAAGEGSRLRQDGWDVPKPMVPVAGIPLIDHAIANFVAAGIRKLVIIFNEEEQACADRVLSRFPELELRVLVKTTASSLESYREVVSRAGPGALLVSTVDAWCPTPDFARFASEASRIPGDPIVLAVTSLVYDERPLWVRRDPAGRIREIGGAQGDGVTAGMYLFPERIRSLSLEPTLARLRDLLAWLLARGEILQGVPVGDVIDVDRGIDVLAAERLARQHGESPDPSIVPSPEDPTARLSDGETR